MASSKVSGVRVAGAVCAVPPGIRTVADETFFTPETGAKISRSTGIEQRRIAGDSVCASDLCCKAAEHLLSGLGWDRSEITGLIFISQTPDYVLPATSFSIHRRLGLPDTCFAFDVNLGCSGYVYGLWMAVNLMPQGRGKVLLLVGDTISRITSPQDQSSAFLFGDAGSATGLERDETAAPIFFELGSDGEGESKLIVPAGGFRNPRTAASCVRIEREAGNLRSEEDLYMDGPEIFAFTLNRVPAMVKNLFASSNTSMEDIDAFVFHQANTFMLSHLAKRMKVPAEKLILAMTKYGNTSSASIPLAIAASTLRERLTEGRARLMLAGFGVGFSWAGAVLECGPGFFPEVIGYDA